ncbi:TPM domain-containing protein [Mesorhizobium sp. ANAO-SY3R2]|uniref:TPM domain-containing protein n=1 Tax=Mesorhizobium sp. ANAO-SY3R2 TaxID=3166644 RepID=UPI00367025D5
MTSSASVWTGQRGVLKRPLGIASAIFLLLVLALPALAAELPALTGRVVDDAGILDPSTKAALVQKLADFEKKSSDQIVVATIPSLGGEEIEPYANRLYRAWKLGQAGEDNGILVLVAPNDRRMRIEVGYGLEGTLTDLHSKLIIENTMVPAFRAGDYSGGVSKAVDDVIMVLEGNGEELEARARRNEQTSSTGLSEDEIIFFVFLALWATMLFGGMAMAVLPRMFGRKLGPARYEWLGMTFDYNKRSGSSSGGGWTSGGWSGGGGGWSSGGGGFSGGGGSSGGGGASGGW